MGESLPRNTAAHQERVMQSLSQPGICQLPLHKGAATVPFNQRDTTYEIATAVQRRSAVQSATAAGGS